MRNWGFIVRAQARVAVGATMAWEATAGRPPLRATAALGFEAAVRMHLRSFSPRRPSFQQGRRAAALAVPDGARGCHQVLIPT